MLHTHTYSHNNQAMSSINKPPVKKKYCPQCGNQIARKCKKCPSCGKRFGVYTFGRKVCPSCGRVNLARMTACYECGYSMQDAVKALPKAKDGMSVYVCVCTFHQVTYHLQYIVLL